MIYSRNIWKKFPMKFRGTFPNNVSGILNIGIFPECSMNILGMLHASFSVDQEMPPPDIHCVSLKIKYFYGSLIIKASLCNN